MRNFLAGLLLLVAAGAGALAQAGGGTSPDCTQSFRLTAAGSTATFDNRSKYCSVWVLTYTNEGHSALTLTIQAAPITTGGAVGSWGTATGTFTGTHPAVTATHAQVRLDGFHPYMRVTLSGLTGTGVVTGRLFGYRRTTP